MTELLIKRKQKIKKIPQKYKEHIPVTLSFLNKVIILNVILYNE